VCLHCSSCSGEPRLRSLQIIALLCDETRVHVGALVTHTGDYVWRKEGKISFNVITMMKNADEIVRTQKQKTRIRPSRDSSRKNAQLLTRHIKTLNRLTVFHQSHLRSTAAVVIVFLSILDCSFLSSLTDTLLTTCVAEMVGLQFSLLSMP
jgi:K+-sensing histidine kinase KdpD